MKTTTHINQVKTDLIKSGHSVEWKVIDGKPYIHFLSKFSPVLIWSLSLKYNGIGFC